METDPTFIVVFLLILIFFGVLKIKLMSRRKFFPTKYNDNVKPVAMFLGGGLLICPGCDQFVGSDAEKCEFCGVEYNSNIRPVSEARWDNGKFKAVHSKS